MKPRTSFAAARCLVTGASSGLGKAMAGQLLQQGAQVIVTGRTLSRLEATLRELLDQGANPSTLIAVDADLTEPEGRHKLVHAVDRHFGALDLLINTAEVGARIGHEATSEANPRAFFDLNVFALIDLCTATLPLLEAGQSPALINLASLSHESHPFYHASKHAIIGFTSSIRASYKESGVHVFLMNPEINNIKCEKNHINDFVYHEIANQTLHALRLGREELNPKSRSRHLFQQFISTSQATRRILHDWLHHFMKSSHVQSTQTARRLPRPHFGLRMQRTKKTGD